jgi:hypothetical protein
MEIRKGMYSLLQASILANKLPKKRLTKHGYFEQPHTPGLWRHTSRQIWFNLAVDDFEIKYIGKGNLQNLYDTLRKETYNIVEDRAGKLHCGVNLKWNYNKGYINLSMPKYVMKQLTRYAHPNLTDHSIAPSCPIPSRMARILKHLCLLMTVLSLTIPVSNASNKLSVVSCTMHGPLI